MTSTVAAPAVANHDLREVVLASETTDANAEAVSVVYRPRRLAVISKAATRFDGTPRWLVVFADLVALLIAFFVLILSMSAFEPDAVARLTGNPAGAAGANAQLAEGAGNGSAATSMAVRESGAGARYLAGVLQQQLAAVAGPRNVSLQSNSAVTAVFAPSTLFAGAGEGADVYEALRRIARAAPGRVTVFTGAAVADKADMIDAITGLGLEGIGVAIGFAGWLEADQVAVVVRDPRSGAGE